MLNISKNQQPKYQQHRYHAKANTTTNAVGVISGTNDGGTQRSCVKQNKIHKTQHTAQHTTHDDTTQ